MVLCGFETVWFQAAVPRLQTFTSRPELAGAGTAALECATARTERSFMGTRNGSSRPASTRETTAIDERH